MGVQPLKSDVGDDWIAVRMAFSPFSSNALVLRHRKGPTGAPRSARASILLNRPNLITYRAPVSMAMETTAGDSSPIKLRRRDGPGRKRIPGGARTAAYRSAFAFENGDEENHSTPHA